MTDLATSPAELHAALIAKYRSGGADLSVVHQELIFALVRLFAELRKAPASDIPRLMDAISRAEAMLPAQQPGFAPLRDRLGGGSAHVA
jgi:hypothetical protein